MNTLKLAGAALLLAACVATAGASQVILNARATLTDYLGNPIDISQPVDRLRFNGVLLHWTVYVEVTGDNQGLAGAIVSMGIQYPYTASWAHFAQPRSGLSFPPSYKATTSVPDPEHPGRYVDQVVYGGIDASAAYGGVGAGKGASVGTPDRDVCYVDQMGMGYLDWHAHRFHPVLGRWVGDQQWGVGLESRKSVLLAAGDQGTYDLVQGTVDVSYEVPPDGTYRAVFDLATCSASVLDSGIDLNTDHPSVPMTDVPSVDIVVGKTFEFTFYPEPATLLVLAAGAFGIMKRRPLRHS